MHLLQAKAGVISDGSEAVELGQTPGDIIVLSAADSDLSSLAAANATITPTSVTLRLANVMQLTHPMSVDAYVDDTLSHAKLIVIRLLGGKAYWSYGVEQVVELSHRLDIPLALLPGDDQPDAELTSLSTLAPEKAHRLWQYFVHGGPDNAQQCLAYAASLLGHEAKWLEPRPLVRA
ncbi:MAG: cobaltochelatase subunit CobN, partial [Pseudomonadota bacterium]